MLEKNLKRIDFDQVLEKLSSFAVTDFSQNRSKEVVPSTSFSEVSLLLKQTQQAMAALQKKGNIPLENYADITISLKSLESNFNLSAKALLEIAHFLRIGRNIKDYFLVEDGIDPSFFDAIIENFQSLYTNLSIEQKIFSCLPDENTISDEASPLLNRLRKNRKNLEHSIRTKLNQMIHSNTISKYLMDHIITIRNDRFVIPVKDEFRDKVPGAVLDISASGSTLYIEPSSIYEMNNQINHIKQEEEIEIQKILKNLSLLLVPIVANLKDNMNLINKIDLIFARAKYSQSFNGVLPIINQERKINLIGARHPLIDTSHVVPIHFVIGQDYTTLLITGPNTGGKTATLKTVGLLEAMACSGILIPAKEGSSIYVFDHLFADIGDEQSIQESLSTFSSHITNIIDILQRATSDSLILLDELGAGTDPVEGSSLAISILDFFHQQKAITIATTHYPELKNYALMTDGFENASVDFDVQTLQPTYQLLIGIPGKSNAFAIGKKLGLSNQILDRAKDFLTDDSIHIESLLKEIYDSKIAIEEEKEKILQNSHQVELLRKSLEKDHSHFHQEAENIIQSAKEKAQEILLDAKEEANEIIHELEKENISNKEANLLRRKLNQKLDQVRQSGVKSPSNGLPGVKSPQQLQIGDVFFLTTLNQSVTVLSLPDKEGNLQVQIGSMKSMVSMKDLVPISNNTQINTVVKTSQKTFHNAKALNVSSELNVIGLNINEALPIVDKYLDDAYLASLENVRIVHGKGTGKLREGIQSFLKNHPHVRSYRVGSFGEGEMGVTVVTLKK